MTAYDLIDIDVCPRTIETPVGVWPFVGSTREASWFRSIAEAVSHTKKGAELVRRAAAEGCRLSFFNLGSTTLGAIAEANSHILIDPDLSLPTMARILVHECAHNEQFRLGLSSMRENMTLSDALLEDRIREAAAFTLSLEAAWEMGKNNPGTWAITHAATPLLSLNMDWHLALSDNEGNRNRARAAMFMAFFSDRLSEGYEGRMIAKIEEMPAEKLRGMIEAKPRNRDDYKHILENHGFRHLRQHLPDLDWNAPFWCGLYKPNRDRLAKAIAEKCPDLAKDAVLPPVSHRISRKLAPIYGFVVATQYVCGLVPELTPLIKRFY